MADVDIHQRYEDEIDLFDLIDDIKDKWYWLVGCTLAGALAALVYVLVATPEYETEALITDTSPSELLPFNQPALRSTLQLAQNSDEAAESDEDGEPVTLTDEAVFELTVQDAFSGARSNLRSASSRKAFYNKLAQTVPEDKLALISSSTLTEEQNLSNFLERFSFEDSSAKQDLDTFVKVSFRLKADAELARDLLNDYVDFALDRYHRQVKSEFQRKVAAELELNRTWAANFRSAYEFEKQRRIALLEEAAGIAKTIGQERPFYNNNDVVVSSEPPLYMMGFIALNREAELMKQRSELPNEDVFVEGLSLINNYIKTLENVSIDWGSVKLVEIDQPALLPIKPAKPRKPLVVALGGIGGVILGVLAALIAAASNRHLRRSERR